MLTPFRHSKGKNNILHLSFVQAACTYAHSIELHRGDKISLKKWQHNLFSSLMFHSNISTRQCFLNLHSLVFVTWPLLVKTSMRTQKLFTRTSRVSYGEIPQQPLLKSTKTVKNQTFKKRSSCDNLK